MSRGRLNKKYPGNVWRETVIFPHDPQGVAYANGSFKVGELGSCVKSVLIRRSI
jgi:hypothetical protein